MVAHIGDDATIAEAQAGLDRLAVKLDDRRRVRDGEPPPSPHWPRRKRCARHPPVAFPAEFST